MPFGPRRVMIVNDMIVSGGTVLAAAYPAHVTGALDSLAVAAHGLFAKGSGNLFTAPELAHILVIDGVPGALDCGARIVSAVSTLAAGLKEIASAWSSGRFAASIYQCLRGAYSSGVASGFLEIS